MASIEIKGQSTGGGGGGGTGTVTSVALSSGTIGSDINVSGSPITTFGTLILNVPVAGPVNTGKLSSTDWLSFNGKQAALTLTTTGSSGAATLVGATLNIPQYTGGAGTVTSVAVASGITGSDVNVTGSPITGAGSITVNIPVASAVNTGKLSSANFTTFNNKQNAITLTTTGTSGAATLTGATLNVPNYATAPGGTNGQVQYNNGGAFGGGVGLIWDDFYNYLGIGSLNPTKVLEVFDPGDQSLALFANDTIGALIVFKDVATINDLQVGVGALGNLLILRGGGSVDGTIQIDDTYADFKSNELRNFTPRSQTTAINLTIDATNSADLNGSVLEVTGALTVTIDGGVTNRFNISVIQMDANQTTFVGAGGLTLRNRQGHTTTFGQYSTVTLYVTGNDLILAGDTAP